MTNSDSQPVSASSLFGRWEKLALLILGFLLTTVGGAVLAHYIWQREDDIARRDRERVAAYEALTSIATLSDRRIVRARLVHAARRQNGRTGVAQLWQALNAVADEWRANETLNRARACLYFGREAETYVQNIGTLLSSAENRLGHNLDLDPELRRDVLGDRGFGMITGDSVLASLPAIDTLLTVARTRANDLSRFMMAAVSAGSVGRYSTETTCPPAALPKISP